MRTRRLVPAVIAGAAVLSLALSGCGLVKDIAKKNPAAKKSQSPAEVLISAAKAVQEQPYTFKVKDEETTGEGAVDPDAKTGTMKVTISGNETTVVLELLITPDQSYVRITPVTSGKWTKIDRNRIDADKRKDLEQVGDPAGAAGLFAGIVTAEKVADGQYRGTVDLTKSVGVEDSVLVDSDHYKGLADAAKSVPFEATVDGKNRLTSVKLTLPKGGNEKERVAEITYSDLGTKPKIDIPPADQVTPAPDTVYAIFNS